LNLGSAATLIMTLGDISSVYIKGDVDEADIGKAACGQHVRTKVESFPNESFEGVVKRIAPMGKELNNVTTFEVRVTISNLQRQTAGQYDRQRRDRARRAQKCSARARIGAGI
jgi:HlyD family secretion protein